MKIDESKFRFRIGDKVIYKGKERTIVAYCFSSGFNNYSEYYGYVVDYPSHDAAGISYNENGELMVFPKDSVHTALESNLSPILSVADRLRYAPSGIELFSPAYGEVNFCRVLSNNNIETKKSQYSVCIFRHDGRINSLPGSECLLFPSKENRDWATVDYSKPRRKDLPINTLCFVTDGIYRKDSCFFRYYAANSECYTTGNTSTNEDKTTSWAHIVPVDKLDFKTLTHKPEDDYGTKSEYNR